MINPLEGAAPISILSETVNQQPKLPPQQPKPKVKVKVAAEPWNSTKSIYSAGEMVMPYDKQPVKRIIGNAARTAGIRPEFLQRSAYQEGMNRMLSNPDEKSEAWFNARKKDISMDQFPVDGFFNYGLDFIGEKGNIERLQKKGYLPKGFENNMKVYQAYNEKKQLVPTAAFRNNEAALMAKAAVLRDFQDKVDEYAVSHKLKLTPQQRDYFTSASYNGGWGNGRTMMNEFISSKDRAGFIEKGLTSRKGVHKNVYPRVSELEQLSPLFK